MEAVETMCMDTLVTNCSRSTTHKCHASRIYPNLPMSFWTQQRLEQFQRQAQRQWRVRLQLLGQRRRTRSLWSNRRSGLGRPWMDWKAWIWTRRLRWPIPSLPSGQIQTRRRTSGRRAGPWWGRDRRPVSSRKWSWLWQQGRSHNHCNYYRLGTRWWYIETTSQFTEPSSVLGVLTSASASGGSVGCNKSGSRDPSARRDVAPLYIRIKRTTLWRI